MRFAIPAIQYHRPNARKEEGTIDATPEGFEAWLRLHKRAPEIFVTLEVLPTGHVSACLDNGHEDLATCIVPNGMELVPAISQMIVDFESRNSAGVYNE